MKLRADYPPLSCRTSPPQGGRSDGRDGFPKQLGQCNSDAAAREQWSTLLPISPLVGEMSGRTEGGAPSTTSTIPGGSR
ncbi:hypothetical protein EFD55_06895 [Rhizobium pisi]|uniref:Propionyl-coenzyme A carboxylase alpha polypeptide n=1 Tax=Rhizobium pisi TaxID=574561 RepID=A0A427N4Z3_9HYPH|nr:hypothetical protein EFD55_06895 [Rhizobium pisi]TCA46748.1 hypothetical protein E0J16_28895 [Rhizobium pisi]